MSQVCFIDLEAAIADAKGFIQCRRRWLPHLRTDENGCLSHPSHGVSTFLLHLGVPQQSHEWFRFAPQPKMSVTLERPGLSPPLPAHLASGKVLETQTRPLSTEGEVANQGHRFCANGAARAHLLHQPCIPHFPRPLVFHISRFRSTVSRSLSSLLPVSSWPSFPLGMRISVNGASGVRVRVRLRVILKGPCSLRGPREMAMARASLVRSSLAWLHVCG